MPFDLSGVWTKSFGNFESSGLSCTEKCRVTLQNPINTEVPIQDRNGALMLG